MFRLFILVVLFLEIRDILNGFDIYLKIRIFCKKNYRADIMLLKVVL